MTQLDLRTLLSVLCGVALLCGCGVDEKTDDEPRFIWELMNQKGQLQQSNSWDSAIFPGIETDAKVIAIQQGPFDPGATRKTVWHYGATVGSNTGVSIGDEICRHEGVGTWEEVPGFDPMDRMLAKYTLSTDTCGWGLAGATGQAVWQRVESTATTTAGRESALPMFALRLISISPGEDSDLPAWTEDPDRTWGDSPDVAMSFSGTRMMDFEPWFGCDPADQKPGLPYCDHVCDEGTTVSEVNCEDVDWTAFRYPGQ